MSFLNLILKWFGTFFNSLSVQDTAVPTKNIFDAIADLLKNNTATKKIINIIGFRDESKPNTWNDLILFNVDNKIIICTATTDPGEFYTNKPLDKSGCAHLPDGYYDNIWKLGLHRGEYEALIHDGKIIRVWRDSNKNFMDDEGNLYEKSSAINLHHGND